jgi:hypothetical protein
MFKFACIINAICIGGMCVLFWSVGSGSDTVTAPVVPPKAIVLADGMYGQYNENVAERCAEAAIALGKKDKLSPKAIDKLFNQCVYEMGITI